MNHKVLKAAEEAGLVRFIGGEMEAYELDKPSAYDHQQQAWSFASYEKLVKFIEALEKEQL